MTNDDNPFWRFSLSLYRQPAVPEACLQLQARHHCDVNLLLFCLWLPGRGMTPAAAQDVLHAAMAAAADWHQQVVVPLRQVRQRLKGGLAPVAVSDSEPLRQEIKRLELAAEQQEQMLLWQQAVAALPESAPATSTGAASTGAASTGAPSTGDPSLAASLLADMMAAQQSVRPISAADCRQFAILLAAAFPTATASQVTAAANRLQAAFCDPASDSN